MTRRDPARFARCLAVLAAVGLAAAAPVSALAPDTMPDPASAWLRLPAGGAPADPWANLILVQQSCGNCGSQSPGQSGPSGPSGPSANGGNRDNAAFLPFTPANTDGLVIALKRAIGSCDGRYVDSPYRIDCLHWALRKVARDLPRTGDFAPIRTALLSASDQLSAIVQANLDPGLPPVQPRLEGGTVTAQFPPLRAVRPDRIARANRQARQVLDQTVTVLLRSASESERRRAPYQDVAAVLGSAKVLLRSS